jgi:stress response protein SCP2
MVTLSKADGDNPVTGLAKLAVGISWDTTAGMSGGLMGKIKRKLGTDLDLIAVLTSNGEPVRYAGVDVLDPADNGSVLHSGDNQTGHGEGDDETVTIDFNKLNNTPVDGVLFIAAAFKKGSSLEAAAKVSLKVYTQGQSETSLEQVADIWPSLRQRGNAVALAKVHRQGDEWFLTVVNEPVAIRQGERNSLLDAAMGM